MLRLRARELFYFLSKQGEGTKPAEVFVVLFICFIYFLRDALMCSRREGRVCYERAVNAFGFK